MEGREVQEAMTETPEQRAKRLGLASETPEDRAARLGLTSKPSMRDALQLDVRQPSESTSALPYDKDRPGDMEALASAPAGLKAIAPDAAKGAASLALSAAQAIPGMERFQAAAGALGDLTYDESLAALREETGKIPKEVRMA